MNWKLLTLVGGLALFSLGCTESETAGPEVPAEAETESPDMDVSLDKMSDDAATDEGAGAEAKADESTDP